MYLIVSSCSRYRSIFTCELILHIVSFIVLCIHSTKNETRRTFRVPFMLIRFHSNQITEGMPVYYSTVCKLMLTQ